MAKKNFVKGEFIFEGPVTSTNSTFGFWNRTGTTITPATATDNVNVETLTFNGMKTHNITGDGDTIQHDDYATVYATFNPPAYSIGTSTVSIANGSYVGQNITLILEIDITTYFTESALIVSGINRGLYAQGVFYPVNVKERYQCVWDGSSWKATDGLSNNSWTGGDGAFSYGTGTTVSGLSAFAGGNGSTASGSNSIALGSNASATGVSSVAIGNNAISTANNSFSVGSSSTASSLNSIAIGQFATAGPGFDAVAIGNNCKAKGINSLALGSGTESSGTSSFSSGVNTIASGNNSFVFGDFVKVSGSKSVLFGNQTGTMFDLNRNSTFGLHNLDLWLTKDNYKFFLGTALDASIYYNGTNLIIDPDEVGSGIVLIGATGDDDLKLNNIEIDGALNHDGSTIGFFGVTPTTRQTEMTDELTTITHDNPVTPDYVYTGSVTNSSAYGLSSADEFNTMLSVIKNLQTRVNELETKLTAYGLLQDAD